MSFCYVYLLQTQDQLHRYVGLTKDLKERLRKHSAGEVLHTSKFGPWSIQVAIAFRDRKRAVAFERYLKSHSGRAFSKKHF